MVYISPCVKTHKRAKKADMTYKMSCQKVWTNLEVDYKIDGVCNKVVTEYMLHDQK